eukprot:CAMPEP_0168341308 /NCGR_PEP_ID=MMETSP0213-20121227/14597_1 /TAXON_ID=151035 /ORGANISM="Euplotes harpa, Strain FSP1.4" /LENGTH=116 /DNA_ID=CAMNT_0008347741 /DNA_START=1064 /DNA_END=1414 /DNA_ORIENTATION=+
MPSTGMMNRLVKAARGTRGLSIQTADFQLEEACDFGGDIDYKTQELNFRNNCYPDVVGLTSPQLELIAQGIAASSLKHSLKRILVMKEKKGIGKKETERVLNKHGLTNITVGEYAW